MPGYYCLPFYFTVTVSPHCPSPELIPIPRPLPPAPRILSLFFPSDAFTQRRQRTRIEDEEEVEKAEKEEEEEEEQEGKEEGRMC